MSLLREFLALDAVASPGHCFQALGVDLFPAGDALSEIALPDASQGAFYHPKQLPVIGALMKEEFLRIGASGPVGYVLRHVAWIGVPAVLLLGRDFFAQLLLPF